MRTHVLHITIAPLALTLAACNYFAPAPSDYATPFPLNRQQDRVVDVQVLRRDTRLEFVNTTDRPLPAGRLWVNQSFSRPVEAIPVGASASYNLYDFRNRFDEPFRAGGFFATQDPKDVVMVQIHDEIAGEIVGLVVVQGEAEHR